MNLPSETLSRLDGLIATGKSKYKATCPAHDDRTPSLAIKECDDGRLLIHCFAGCDTEDILKAIGLTFSDVMPESDISHKRELSQSPHKPQKWLNAHDALETLDHESLVVAAIGADMLAYKEVDEGTLSRLATAVDRINDTRAKFARCRR